MIMKYNDNKLSKEFSVFFSSYISKRYLFMINTQKGVEEKDEHVLLASNDNVRIILKP